jgi:hypothetical protein
MPRTKYVPPIAFERLDAMIEALQTGELDEAMRKEIIDALDCFFVTLIIERGSRPGRRIAHRTWLIADVVKCLREEHGPVTLKAAIIAALPHGNDRLKNAVARAYQKIKSGKHPEGKINHQLSFYSQAVARLKKVKRETNRG